MAKRKGHPFATEDEHLLPLLKEAFASGTDQDTLLLIAADRLQELNDPRESWVRFAVKLSTKVPGIEPEPPAGYSLEIYSRLILLYSVKGPLWPSMPSAARRITTLWTSSLFGAAAHGFYANSPRFQPTLRFWAMGLIGDRMKDQAFREVLDVLSFHFAQWQLTHASCNASSVFHLLSRISYVCSTPLWGRALSSWNGICAPALETLTPFK